MTLLGTALRRSRAQWRLLTAVLSVSILACTLVASLGLLIPATEQSGVRGSLAAMDATQTNMYVQLVRPTKPIAEVSDLASGAIGSVLGNAATATSTSVALSIFLGVPSMDRAPLTYFGELDTIEDHATLVTGTWATPPDPATPLTIPVALPQAAAKETGLAVGSTIPMRISNDVVVTAVVVGTYKINDGDSRYWNPDPLHGVGSDPAYVRPSPVPSPPTLAFGPLIAAPGAIDAVGVTVLTVDLTYSPDFSHTTVDQLGPLAKRAFVADETLDRAARPANSGVFYTSELSDALYGVGTGLIVTRSTVVVISLLLLLLAIVVVSQTARLLTESRVGERQLMRARGASRGRIIGLAAVEALALGLVTAVVSPLLATLVYSVLAVQPAMVAAGMPTQAGLPELVWRISAAVSIAFVVVLLAPVVRRSDALTEFSQGHGRQRASGGLLRSGLDIALVLVAAVVYWQFLTYRSPVNLDSADLSVDPVLVVGPALVLLACALLCMRLIPLAARLVDRVGQRSRGAIFPLAAWEIGRRTQRATAAVLLLSLTLGVGTFGLSFLATWRQSQIDQATVAVGAPVRVPALQKGATIPASELASGAIGDPQPTLRRGGRIGGTSLGGGYAPSGIDATVIGLTNESRAMLDRGRSADEGGTTVAQTLLTALKEPTGVTFPADAVGVTAAVNVAQVNGAPIENITVDLNAIIEDANGLLSTVDLGRIDADGQTTTLGGQWQRTGEDPTVPGPVRLVGVQTMMVAADDAVINESTAVVLIGQLSAVVPDPADASKTVTVGLPASVGDAWFTHNADDTGKQATLEDPPAGWQFDLSTKIPVTVTIRPVQIAITGWDPAYAIVGVVTEGFSRTITLGEGESTHINIGGASANLLVTGTIPLIPGVADSDQLAAGNTALASSSSRADAVLVDQNQLQRLLMQSGVPGPMVDEWWVDVPVGDGASYLAAHPTVTGGRSSDVLGSDLQQAPIRVATQAALWLVIVAGGLLAAVGFAVHATTTVRARRLELAQLRAIGVSRAKVVGLIGVESLILCVLGIVFGVGIGVLLVFLVGPLVAVSPGGTPPVPSVIVEIPWLAIGALVVGLAAVLGLLVLGVARLQRTTEPAELLREGSDL